MNYEDVLARVQALPGVQSAGLTSFLPLTAPGLIFDGSQIIVGSPLLERGEEQHVVVNYISSDYFQTMSMQLRSGRPFVAQDVAGGPKVAIVNETAAWRFWGKLNPIGRRVGITSPPATIVGVVGDTRHSGLDHNVDPELYLPYGQHSSKGPIFSLKLAVRTAADQNNNGLSSLAAAIRNQVRAIEPNEPLNQVIRMDERLSNSVAGRRFQMILLGVFAGLALVIAAVGVYGVISYAVSLRTHEIGIRMALGAERHDVMRLVFGQGMKVTLLGATLGLAGAFALTRVIKTMLFNVSATDPLTFACVAGLLIAVALIACFIPARRATRVDPLTALRQE